MVDQLRRSSRRTFLAGAAGALVALSGCSSPGPAPATPTTGRSPTPPPTPSNAVVSPTATRTAVPPTATPTATATPADDLDLPIGFPLDRALRTGKVDGPRGERSIAWGAGPAVEVYSRDDQPADDPERANRSGWNARLHVEYEGQPAVDWYIPAGSPVIATMSGEAELRIVTIANPFEVYGVSREPYLGNPDRVNAPIVPFPGPGGGTGVFIRIANSRFTTHYAHLDLERTTELVSRSAFIDGFAPGLALAAVFEPLRDFRTFTTVARWPVRKGDVIGMSGDSGYSEAPHLHYTIARTGESSLLCPTLEPGFAESGWLFAAP